MNKPLQPVHWPSVIQFGCSLLGIITLWGFSLSLIFAGILQQFQGGEFSPMTLSMNLAGAGFGLSGCLLMPSAGYSLAQLLGRLSIKKTTRLTTSGSLFLGAVFVLALLAGNLVVGVKEVAWLVLPFFHLLGIGIPVLWLSLAGRRNLVQESPQRVWGVFASGLVLGPFIIMIAEVAVLLVGGIVLAIWLSSQPGLVEALLQLAAQFEDPSLTPDQAISMVIPYLTNPAIIISVLVFGAGIVPLIEELIKPVGVWLLLGKKLSPAEGLAAGILSGAGYALLESLAMTNAGQSWGVLVVGRMGTGIIHIAATGLVGWSLAMARQKNGYLKLIMGYIIAVLIHALWNGLTLINLFAVLTQEQSLNLGIPYLERIGLYTPLGLPVVALISLLILFLANRLNRTT
jgi:hypothetical protein